MTEAPIHWNGIPPNDDRFGWHWIKFPTMDPIVGCWHARTGFAPCGYWTFSGESAPWRPNEDRLRCAYLGEVKAP